MLLLALLSAPPIAVHPDPTGLIDVPAALVAAETALDREPVPNPFRRHVHPLPAARDVPITINAVVIPAHGPASCVINGLDYQAGERFEGLSLARIDGDSIILLGDRFTARVPLADTPTTLRIPR